MDTEKLDLLSTEEASVYLGLSAATLNQWRFQKKGPLYIRMGGSIRYRRTDLDAFVETSRVDPETALSKEKKAKDPNVAPGLKKEKEV